MKTMTDEAMIIAPRQELIDMIKSQASVIDQLNNAFTTLTMQLDWLKRQIFGTKSERFISAGAQQLALDLGIVKKDELEPPPPPKTTTTTIKHS